jgi:hypothetical protein
MSIILGFGIVWGLTKGLQNLWIHVWTSPLPKLIDYITFSPSYLPFLDFLGQVICFCKPPCASLKTYFKPLQTFKSIITYWHVLKNAWPKQVLYKLSSKPNIPQLTTNLSDVVIIIIINPSSFTHVTIFFFKSHFFNNLVKFLTNFCSTIFMISKF